MENSQRIYHGNITPTYLARLLITRFNRGNLRAQYLGNDQHAVVQIATRERPASGGQTALSVNLEKVEDGVAILIGQQNWLGVAASLGATAISALRNPFSLLGRLDDLAQDIEYLQLRELVWETVEEAAKAAGAAYELSERLRRITCEYCLTANPLGEPACIACGAPLGRQQPVTCAYCGFVIKTNEAKCPNCGKPILPLSLSSTNAPSAR